MNSIYQHKQLKEGGKRRKYSRGTIRRLQKGLIIGTSRGKTGQLCGSTRGIFLYRDKSGKPRMGTCLSWISRQFKIKHKSA